MEWFADWLFGWVFELLYILQKSICVIIDFIVEIFRKLAGIETVVINGQQEDLLSHFLLSNGVKIAFLGVLLVGVVLLTVFTIVSILRSETADGQHKKTKGQILTKSGQAFLIFIAIPFLVLAGIMLSQAIMSAIDQSMTLAATGGVGNSTVGGQILVTSGSGAFKGSESERAYIEQCFINGTYDYNNLSLVKKYYDLSEMNFFVGIGSGLVILVMFVIAAIMFVQRIFDIILLYVISPVSTATIPIDDGGRFRIWREMLISKILGAYGIILSMNIFFLIIPQVNSIKFFSNSFQNGVVSLLFIIGGAFSVTKASMIIAQLTGNNAGAQEAQQMMSNIHTGYRMARTFGAGAAAIGGQLLGGSDFKKNQKRGANFMENLASTAKSTRNQNQVGERNGERTGGQKAAAATRLATMPIGMLKDFSQGGLITMGKNFIPRVRNVFGGTSVTSRADVKKKPDKASGEGGKPSGGQGGGGDGGDDKQQQAKVAAAAVATGGASAAAGAGSAGGAGASAGSTGGASAGSAGSGSAGGASASSTGTGATGGASASSGSTTSGTETSGNSTGATGSTSGTGGNDSIFNQSGNGTNEPPSDWTTNSQPDMPESNSDDSDNKGNVLDAMNDVVQKTAEIHVDEASESVSDNTGIKGDDKK